MVKYRFFGGSVFQKKTARQFYNQRAVLIRN